MKQTDKSIPAWVDNMIAMMERHGLNPRSLSLRAGLNPTAVRDMMEGRSRFPRYDTVQALAAALDTTPAILMIEEKAGGDLAAQGAGYRQDTELLTEIITRLTEVADETGRTLAPREFAAIAATLYRRLKGEGVGTGVRKMPALKPQIHDLLDYDSLRGKRKS